MRPGCPMAAPHLPLAVSVCGPWQSPHRKSIKERLRECRANFLDCWVRGKNPRRFIGFYRSDGAFLRFSPSSKSDCSWEPRTAKQTDSEFERETHWKTMKWYGMNRPFSSTNGQRNFTTSTQLAAKNHRLPGEIKNTAPPNRPNIASHSAWSPKSCWKKRWLDMFLTLKALKLIMKMAIEIVDLPIEHGDFP